MVKSSIMKKWISNLLTFYSETHKNTSLNEKNIKNVQHEEKIIKTESGILQVKSSNEDNIIFDLCDLNITLNRFIARDTPHEVSIFVPRAEIKKTLKTGNDKEYISEVILNSITIVHSPKSNKDELQKLEEKPKDKSPDNSKDQSESLKEIAKPKTQIGFKYLLNQSPFLK